MNDPVACRFRLTATVIASLVLVSGGARSVRAQSDPIFEDDFDVLDESAWTVIPYPPNRPIPCETQNGALAGSCWLESVESFGPDIELELNVLPSSFSLQLGWIDDDNSIAVSCHYSVIPEQTICSAWCITNGQEVDLPWDYVEDGELVSKTLWIRWQREGMSFRVFEGRRLLGEGLTSSSCFTDEQPLGGKIRLQLAGGDQVDYIKVFSLGGSAYGQPDIHVGDSLGESGTGGGASGSGGDGSSDTGGGSSGAGGSSSDSGADSARDGGPESGSSDDDGDNGETDANAGSEGTSDPSSSGGGCGCRVSSPDAATDPGAVSLFLAAMTLSLAGFRRRRRPVR